MRAAPPAPSERGDPSAPGSGAGDRWGELPQQIRDVFRAEGGGDLPARYRDWIDAYHRRLARRP